MLLKFPKLRAFTSVKVRMICFIYLAGFATPLALFTLFSNNPWFALFFIVCVVAAGADAGRYLGMLEERAS